MARCARCGEVFDEDDRRRALALGIDKPVHPRCWAPEWNDIAETYVATFATEDRGSFRIEDVVPFDDPNDAESHKWPTRLQHGWTFDDRRWWEGIAHDLAGWLAIECRHAVADPPRYHDTHPWWHCRHCLEQELLRWWDQVKNKTTWTLPEMDAMDLAFPIFGRLFRSPERPGREEWFEFARKWTTPCVIGGHARRGDPWIARHHAHRSCWKAQQRRLARQQKGTTNRRSEPTNYSPVIQIWENGIRGTELSVRAVNGSAPVPVFVSLLTQRPTPTK